MTKKLDDIFENAPLLEAPITLKERVMKAVKEEADIADMRPAFGEKLADYFITRRAAWSFAAVAAALILTIRILPWPGTVKAPEPVQRPAAVVEVASTEQVNEFVEATLSQVFGGESGETNTYDDESADIDRFISNNLNEIFWINGGSNA